MAFWGVEVKPGKVSPFVPPPEGSKLHLSQASVSLTAPFKSKVALKVKVADGEPLVVCCLRQGATESIGLDLIFDSYTEFSVDGPAAIHLTGYFMPEYELDDAHDFNEDEDEDDEELAGQVIGYDDYGVPILAGDSDSEEDSDYESESSKEDDSSDEDGLRQLGRERTVMIEDVTDSEPSPTRPALPAHEEKLQANGRAAQFEDDDVEASEDEKEESEDEDEEEESEEEEEEEEEIVKEQPVQHTGQKRKAEPAHTPAKKQGVEAPKSGKPVAAAGKTPQQQPQQKTPKSAVKEQQPKSAAKKQQQAAKSPVQTPSKNKVVTADELPSSNQKVQRFPNGFEVEVLKKGRPDAKLAKPGKKVVVKYVGRLQSNNKIFDQTSGNKTFAFRLGVGEVIKGWDRGVENMRVGDKKRITIPPAMAYGTSGVKGAIPPNATLVFEVELVDVK